MSQDDTHAVADGPFWSVALVLWVLALIGAALVLPYVVALERHALDAASARAHLSVPLLLAISLAQSAVLLAAAVVAGLWASRAIGLRTPLIASLVSHTPAPRGLVTTLSVAVLLGVATGLFLIALDHWVFAPMPSVGALMRAGGPGLGPNAWQGLLASFYGAFDEEPLMRLGVLSLIAIGLRTAARALGASKEEPLPSSDFWTANLVTAVLFGLGHLPATAAIAPLTPALIVRAVVLNGSAGIVFGALFRRYGLEWAMASHFALDLVLHVAFV